MKRTIVLIFAVFAALFQVCGQSRTISGKVTDAEGSPLAGVVVTVEGRRDFYSATDDKGMFSMDVPFDHLVTLNFRLMGYLSKSLEITAETSGSISIVLETDYMNLETVVVTGTRTPRLLKNSPILTRVVTIEDINRADALNIGDLLESELPGIEFSYAMDQQVTLNMQGFGGNSVLFLVDGERIAGETLDNIDYNRLNLDNVERVEIIKGAASSLYGSNAVGGVVNLISAGAKEPWSVNLNARYGSHNEQRYGASAGFIAGRVNSLANFQYSSIDSYRMKNDGDYNTFYGGWNWSVKERLQYEPIDGLRLIARGGYFMRERHMQTDSHDRYYDINAGLRGEYDIDGRNRVELSYSFDQYDKSDYLLFNNTNVRDYSNVQNTVRGVYTCTFDPKGRNTIVVGADYMRDYLMSYQFTDNGSYVQHTADMFAQVESDLNERWTLIGGLRYDFFSQKRISHFSPKLSMMYRLENWSFRGSYSGGFRAPTLKEMYMSFDMAGIFMIYGNPDLAPEQSENLSLSAEYTWKYVSASVSGFYNWVENRITTVWNEELKGMMYTNMSPMQVRGVDVSFSMNLPIGINAKLAYTYTDEAVRSGEPLLSQTRPHSATARLGYGKSWKNYGFDIALSGRVLSSVTTEVYTSDTDYEQTESRTYPAYTVWKLTLSQKIWRGISINAVVDNLFNYIPEYYYSNSPSTTGTAFTVGLSVDIERFFRK